MTRKLHVALISFVLMMIMWTTSRVVAQSSDQLSHLVKIT
jgi:hypothetical protein